MEQSTATPTHVALGRALIDQAKRERIGFTALVAARMVKAVLDALCDLPAEQRMDAMGMRSTGGTLNGKPFMWVEDGF